MGYILKRLKIIPGNGFYHVVVCMVRVWHIDRVIFENKNWFSFLNA